MRYLRSFTRARSAIVFLIASLAAPAITAAGDTYSVGGATVERLEHDIPRITADNDYDLVFANGYVHAQDRLFQMDLTRRQASGTMAEVLGLSGLASDIQLRTLGLHRAAVASWPALSSESQLWMQAYADGVNAYLADPDNPLPPEYAALELTREGIPAWTPVDSIAVAKLLAFGLSFDLSDINHTIALLSFQAAGDIAGFDGTALFFEDLYRTAPFDPSITTPGWFETGKAARAVRALQRPAELPSYLNEKTKSLLESYRDAIADIPILRDTLVPRTDRGGSNWWLTGGELTDTGYPMLANDPHLSLDTPATFYEIHLRVTAADRPMDLFGVSFPGAPLVAQGCTPSICWGSTVLPLDATDVYQEKLALNPSDFLPMATYFDGHYEIIRRIKQKYFVNVIGDGKADNMVDARLPNTLGGMTFIVPRRNNGPLIPPFDVSDLHNITALSIQYTGWGATREIDCFRTWARAKDLDDFREGLQYFDIGAQNWAYADIEGNIAYFDGAELPLREDLQNLNFPDGGIPPYFVRDGTHQLRHEWLPLTTPQPGQSIPYEILPQDEMPHEINPERDYILNGNNDPVGVTLDNNPFNQLRTGGGLYYMNPGFATGFRIGRIQSLYDDALAAGDPLTIDDIVSFQGNHQLLDAEVFAPMIVAAFDNLPFGPPRGPVSYNPNLIEAIEYLRSWDFSTPTGIADGYDPGDDPSDLPEPDQAEIDASIAASIYAVWRGQMVQMVIDAPLREIGLGALTPPSSLAMSALRNLIDNIDTNGGYGASGIPFIPGGDVDSVMLLALSEALDLLASDRFAAAFGNSTDLGDYRWGYLHRIVFDHPLRPPFSIPPSGGLSNLTDRLMGVARSGGLGAVDASSHSARADSINEFMFGHGPARRFVGHLTPDGVEIRQTIPGGESGVPGSPHQSDSLMLWLTNRYLEHDLPSFEP